MAKYQVPQFIGTEVKLIGPFTLKQFLWVGAGGAALFALFAITQGGLLFIFLAIPIAGLSLAFAFVKINGLPLLNYVALMISYAINPKKYLYRRDDEGQIQLPSTIPPDDLGPKA